MKKIDLDIVYKYLESPTSFTEDDIHSIENYLLEMREKLHRFNAQYGTNYELSDYVNAILERQHVAV